MPNVLNFVAFQLLWLLTVLVAAKDMASYAIIGTLLFVMVQLIFSAWRLADFKLLLVGLVAGILLDTIWLRQGWIVYASASDSGLAPLWIGCLWVNFMLTLNHSLSWLQQRLGWVVACTVFAAPLSYYAGQALGAVSFSQPLPAVIGLSLSWAVLVPVMMRLARYWRLHDERGKHALV